jgi:hypothetical protein
MGSPGDIAAGPDGALWFTNGGKAIGRITTNGVVTKYTDPGVIYDSGEISAGPDGALWFTNYGWIGRITTNGVVTAYTNPNISQPSGITAGPDGAIWFTNPFLNSIGRITTPATVALTPHSGAPHTAVAVSGSGFDPGDNITVIYETGLSAPGPTVETICSATARSDGTFRCSGDIPTQSNAGGHGIHKIIAKGSPSRIRATTNFTTS